MGSALAAAAAKAPGAEIYICDKNEEKAKEVAERLNAKAASSLEIAEKCDFIFLGVKPNIIRAAISEIKDALTKRSDCTVVSMAAGVNIKS